MQEVNNKEKSVAEITLLIQYAVSAEDREAAGAAVRKYMDNRVALRVLRDFYSSLPEAREEPLTGIVCIATRQDVYLLGVRAGAHEYLYIATDERAGCLGEYQEGIEDLEILNFFGYTENDSFLQRHPSMDAFEDFSIIEKKMTASCPICSVAEGEYHHLGCPVEVCPWCLGQLSRCNCRFDQMQKEEMADDEDLAQFEALLLEKGRVCFKAGQGPSYPSAGDEIKLKRKRK
jgi:hypothetical protein